MLQQSTQLHQQPPQQHSQLQLPQTPPAERRQIGLQRQLERLRGEHSVEPTALRLGELRALEGDLERERQKHGRLT